MTNQADPQSTSILYLDTATAYDLWSEVYDTDGNFLQALDTIEMNDLLPRLLSLIQAPKPWHFVDLGCGTGRNTLLLLQHDGLQIAALDLSPKMLDVARERTLEQLKGSHINSTIDLQVFDMLTAHSVPSIAQHADAVVSTLVLEHVPLPEYFGTVAKMLNPGGVLLLTNMHADMGQISQAGFVDAKTKQKIRPTSYAHTTQATIDEAAKHGLELVGDIQERSVNADVMTQLGPRGQKWLGITVWFGGIFQKRWSP